MRASGHTYAEAATAPTGVEIPLNRQSVEQTKKITTAILTAVVSSHYFESIKSGTFQKSVDRILQANGLPKVIIPIQDILEDCGAIINELVNDIRKTQTQKNQAREEEGEMETEEYNYSQKRTRTQDIPPTENQEKKQREETEANRGMQRAISLESVCAPAVTQQAQQKTHGQKQQMPQQQPQPQRQQQTQQQRSSTAPLPQQRRESLGKMGQFKTRDIGMIVYIRDKEMIDLHNIYEDEAEGKREQIARLVMGRKAVVNWTDPRLKVEHIREMFEKRQIALTDIKYISVTDNIFRALRTEVVAKQTKKK